ncbi:MAG: PTS system nitrogen regulatory IIA component [Chlamydiales bacterium]|jgi:PTS system nitrogen regulatory IIA component
MVMIAKYLSKDAVKFLEVEGRDETIQALVSSLGNVGKIQDEEEFFHAILDREKIVSTGIGMGVAIPHAKLSSYEDFFIAIGILRNGVDWNALDGAPVRIVFLVGGPDDKQTQYLQILSSLTIAVKDEKRRKKMLMLNSPEDVVQLFEEL